MACKNNAEKPTEKHKSRSKVLIDTLLNDDIGIRAILTDENKGLVCWEQW
jgi:hypothetical protein